MGVHGGHLDGVYEGEEQAAEGVIQRADWAAGLAIWAVNAEMRLIGHCICTVAVDCQTMTGLEPEGSGW